METQMTKAFRFKCGTCNDSHEGLPDVHFTAPTPYLLLTNHERKTIAWKTGDLCSIRDEHFFVRGVIELPIRGRDDTWRIGAWVSLAKRNFDRHVELFDSPDPSGDGPYFGWLCNSIPLYPETALQKTSVYLRPAPSRPAIVLASSDHPLAVHQRNGIPVRGMERLIEVSVHGHRAPLTSWNTP